MAYDKQAFVVNQVLTSDEMNQVEENIAQARKCDIGSAEPPQAVVGVNWIFDGQTPWVFRVTDTGSAWIDVFELNATTDEARPVLPSSATTNSLAAITSSHEAVVTSLEWFEGESVINIYTALAAFDVI